MWHMRTSIVGFAIFCVCVVITFAGAVIFDLDLEGRAGVWNDRAAYAAVVHLSRDIAAPNVSHNSVNAVDNWLQGKSLLLDQFGRPLAGRSETGVHDPWGNPYKCVSLPQDAANGRLRQGIYSPGPDATSATSGNDPDDINSWSDPDEAHWFWVHWNARLPNRLIFGCIAGAILYAAGHAVRCCLPRTQRASS
jgi:hypothetical protein